MMLHDLIQLLLKRHTTAYLLEIMAAQEKVDSLQEHTPPTQCRVETAAVLEEAAKKIREIQDKAY